MHLVTGQLGHGGVRVIVVLAGLLDLLLKRLLVFLRGGKTSGCGIGLVLSGGGILVGLCDLGLRGDILLLVRSSSSSTLFARSWLAPASCCLSSASRCTDAACWFCALIRSE